MDSIRTVYIVNHAFFCPRSVYLDYWEQNYIGLSIPPVAGSIASNGRWWCECNSPLVPRKMDKGRTLKGSPHSGVVNVNNHLVDKQSKQYTSSVQLAVYSGDLFCCSTCAHFYSAEPRPQSRFVYPATATTTPGRLYNTPDTVSTPQKYSVSS